MSTTCNIYIGTETFSALHDGYPSFMVPLLADYLISSKSTHELWEYLSDDFSEDEDLRPNYNYHVDFAAKEIK